MATVSTLLVNLKANTAAFVKKINDSRKHLFKFSQKSKQALAAIGKAFKILGVAAAAGLGVVIYKMNQAFESIDKVAKISSELNVSTEALIGFEHAAKITGVSLAEIHKSLQVMTRRLGEARNGTGEAVAGLETLGLSAQQLIDMGPEKAFIAVAEAISKIPDVTAKAYAAYAIFSRQGISMLNTLNLGEQGLAAMRKEAEQLGITFNNIQAAQIEAANDAVTRAKSAFQGFVNILAIELAPVVSVIAEQLVDYTSNVDRATVSSGGFVEGLIVVAKVVSFVGNAFKLLWHGLRVIIGSITGTITFIVGGLIKIIGLVAKLVGLGNTVEKMGDATLDFSYLQLNEVAKSIEQGIIPAAKGIGATFGDDFGKEFADSVAKKKMDIAASIKLRAEENQKALSDARLAALADDLDNKPGTTPEAIGMQQSKNGGALEYRSRDISFAASEKSQYAQLYNESRKNTQANLATSKNIQKIANQFDNLVLG